MVIRTQGREIPPFFVGVALVAALLACGCATNQTAIGELTVRDALERYWVTAAYRIQTDATTRLSRCDQIAWPARSEVSVAGIASARASEGELRFPYFTLGMAPQEQPTSPESQPTASRPLGSVGEPADYWRKSAWHQMRHEAKALLGRDFWRGFKTSFWDLENALLLTAAMGASVTIRETGVDGTVRSRVRGHRQLGDMDETIQILGNPGTHFAGTGVLWLTSALTKDVKQHELAKALTQALAINGVTTLTLKLAANTRAPDGDPYAWPSGHTSSAVTVAAVLNEYYGPWAGIPAFALAGLVGYQRIDSREHDLSDVVFGAMLGYVVGTSIARDEKAQFPELFGMTVVPFTDVETGASGLALMKSW